METKHLTELVIRRPDDFHVHLRDGDMLRFAALFTAVRFARALVMPNLCPPILTAQDALSYRERILAALEPLYSICRGFEPLMSIQLTDNTRPQMIQEASRAGVKAAKAYPVGVTTNSENGLRGFDQIDDTLRAMEECGMLLLIHGESPDQDISVIDREAHFLPVVGMLAGHYPRLKIVLEHISTAAAVRAITRFPETVAATITPHHLVLTLNDVIGKRFNPHNFCMPIAKRPEDREALIRAATSGDSRFFAGTDSAPHLRSEKESCQGPAGVFCAPRALDVYAEVFEKARALDRLEAFLSINGARFYGLPLNEGAITLKRGDWREMAEISGVVPFLAGERLSWRFVAP